MGAETTMMEERPDEKNSRALIKQLGSCNKSSRDRALKVLLCTWLPAETDVPDDTMKKLWKGLFYCIWHADKVPVQTQLIDRLSSVLPKLDLSLSLHYLSVFLLTIRREWIGIDALRLDKFYLLIRRFLHNFFVLMKNNSWDLELSNRLMKILEENTFFAKDKFQGNGVNYHIASVFLEELRPFLPVHLKVLHVLFGPFLSVMTRLPDKILMGKVKSNMFEMLLNNGKKLLEVKKSGEDIDSSEDVVVFGSIALKMGFSGKFYELGSSSECCQGNRKVLFVLHEEFLKLEKDLVSSGIDVSFPNVIVLEEDEVPELVPIATEDMQMDSLETSQVDQNVNGGTGSKCLKKCRKGDKASGSNDKKAKKKKKKNVVSDSDLTQEDYKNEVIAKDGKLLNEQITGDNLIPMNESVISNLQLQFEKIAAEAGMDDEVLSACDLPKVTITSAVSKKRKRRKSIIEKQARDAEQNGNEDAEGGMTAKSGEKSAKKVRFSMKNNLVWKPHSPLPPQSLRLPPSVTPRGSALKKGVPPGPIEENPTPTRKAKMRAVSAKKSRKVIKRVKTIKSHSAK